MARHSRGVSLRARGAGTHFYRDEADADGGKRHLRRRARRRGERSWRHEFELLTAQPRALARA